VISAVSTFEVTLKHRPGKLRQAAAFAVHHERMLADLEGVPLPVSVAHAALAGRMDIPHKDPFDRLPIAQARIERVPIVSKEALFNAYGGADLVAARGPGEEKPPARRRGPAATRPAPKSRAASAPQGGQRRRCAGPAATGSSRSGGWLLRRGATTASCPACRSPS
jgi:PIN domain nuclease of toxin-antitoxin system